MRVVGSTTVPTISLDHAAARYGFEDACFVKIDTQGTELDILASGEQLVARSVLGVQVEAEFQPFYAGQPVFADLDAYLRERGFVLVDLKRRLLRGSDFRTEFYSRRQLVWAHCVYLRPHDALAVDSADETERRVARWLGLVLAHEYFDLAFRAVADGVVADTFRPDIEVAARAVTKRRLARVSSSDAERLFSMFEKD
jgi:hypothetical protein